MRCIVCGRTTDGVAERSLEIAAKIDKALGIVENKEEIKLLLQRKKKFDRISFTHVAISDEVFNILEKYVETEKSNNEQDCLICMHCKALVDNMVYVISP